MLGKSQQSWVRVRVLPDWALALTIAVIAASGFWWWHSRGDQLTVEACLAPTGALPSPNDGMVRIKGGRFTKGSERFRAEEAPTKEAAVSDFWIDAHDVSNAEFERFVRAAGYVTVAERSTPALPAGSMVFKAPASVRNLADISQWWTFVPGSNWRHPEGPRSDISHRMQHPVVHIAYEDAEAYAKWAGRVLPTEAQWEYASRGGLDGKAYAWGDDPDTDSAPKANVWRGVFPVVNLGSNGFKGTSPVGCFPPNGYGLYDMTGNVWQWTRDAWSDDHTDEQPGTKPKPPTAGFRVIKGGSFLCATNFCMRYRPAARQPGEAALGASHIGFRTVLPIAAGQ